MNYGLLGAAGFVAPRHMQAIKDTGGELIAACDISDSVGILDRFSYKTQFFTSPERFERFINKNRVSFVSICTPNYLHDAHCRMALNAGADAICEKPLVIMPHNLDALEQLEQETGGRIYTVLQLRLHPLIKKLKAEVTGGHRVHVEYRTPRGNWYHWSWKGDTEKSGGLSMNIGIHLFDMLFFIFGENMELIKDKPTINLSINPEKPPERSITIDGQKYTIDGFEGLHTEVYKNILNGDGFGISDARPAVEYVAGLK